MRIIALITDYGTRDYYAGALKGVIASAAPDARVVDITHEIESQNVAHGALVLWQSWAWFPAETIFLTVIDPGVGTQRRVLVGKFADRYVVAPDNGLITWVRHEHVAQDLHAAKDSRYFLPEVSSTFHGRDIMAPVAAHLARGLEPAAFGPAIADPQLLPILFRAEAAGGGLRGQIIYVDRFGNLVTNIHREQLADAAGELRPCRIVVDSDDLGPPRKTFSEAGQGEALAYFGSAGFLEIGISQGRAVEFYKPTAGLIVEVHLQNDARAV